MKIRDAVRECNVCKGLVVLETQRDFLSEAQMENYIRRRLAAHRCGPRGGSAAAVIVTRKNAGDAA